MSAPGRNEPCHCGSGEKYKLCHLRQDEREADPRYMRRALIRVLGYDPDVNDMWTVQHPIPGIRILDAEGEPIHFIAEQALRKIQDTDGWAEAYDKAWQRELEAGAN